jgi:hypothetical protein
MVELGKYSKPSVANYLRSGRGITEILPILGGFFVGFGGAELLINNQSAYLVLGIAYLVVAAVRAISMFVDKSVVRSNVISVISEVIFGVILVLKLKKNKKDRSSLKE